MCNADIVFPNYPFTEEQPENFLDYDDDDLVHPNKLSRGPKR